MNVSAYQTTFLLTIFLLKHFIAQIQILKSQKAQKIIYFFRLLSLWHAITAVIKISIILRCHARKLLQTNTHLTIFEIVATIKSF